LRMATPVVLTPPNYHLEQPSVVEPQASSASSSQAVTPTNDEVLIPRYAKRYRVRVACAQCKKSKQRCDNGRPCSRCISKGRAAECKDDDSVPLEKHEKQPSKRRRASKANSELGDSLVSDDRTVTSTADSISKQEDINKTVMPRSVDFTRIFDDFASNLTPLEIHNLIVRTPLRW
jgi:hypothetical protein